MRPDPALDEAPESIRAARAIEPRPLAWWGMMLTIAVLATMYAAMYFSYVYIRIGVRSWPPPGVEPPALQLPVLSVAALLVSALALRAGLRRSQRTGLGAERLGLFGALVLAAAHIGLLAVDWGSAGFGIDVHSYAALYFTLPIIHLCMLAIGMLMAVLHLALSFRPADLPRRAIGLRALGAYWYLLAFGGTGLLAVVYLTPHVWPVA